MSEKVIPDSERHLPETPEEQLAIYAQLHKIPVEPPCDVCPWRKYPDKVQGCDNCGCGYMHLYVAQKYKQKAFGYWPYTGQEVETVKMLLQNAMNLLNQVQKKGDTEDEKTR